jgi:hypothetical protein
MSSGTDRHSSDESGSVDMEVFEMVVNDETDHDEEESRRRDNVRRQYRRRLTIDPLSDIGEEIQRMAEGADAQDDDGDSNDADSVHDEYMHLFIERQDMMNDLQQNDTLMEENNNEPPGPARDHNYLPTAQPLYPEEWVPAGRHRLRQRMENGSFDHDFDTGHTMDDRDEQQPTQVRGGSIHCSIPPPPGLFLTNTNAAVWQQQQPAKTVLPILEIDNVVLFPGSTLPLRLHDSNWIEYLGNLIDDARGLYGSHANEAEVRIGILPRIRRRTRRRPRESGATGRWRVDLIRRGVTSVRRSRAGEVRGDTDAQHDVSQDRETGQHNEAAVAAQQPEIDQTQEEADSGDNDGMFHASPSRARSLQHDDPLIGRVGTIATIIFTHEETMNPVEVPAVDNRNGRQSSMVWRRHTNELVITAIGTVRFRIMRSSDGRSGEQIQLYEIEEVSDGNVSIPHQLMRLPGDLRNTTLMTISLNDGNVEPENKQGNNDASDEQEIDEQASATNKDDKNKSIQNLAVRSAVPAVAYRMLWPWHLSQKICTLLQETESFKGIYSALSAAAGVQIVDETGRTYLRVIDSSAFANWLSSNLPLDQNDRLDILEMPHVLEQLIFILKKIQGMAEPVLRCKYCGTVITNMSEVFTVGGAEGTTGAYVNEFGVVHQTVTVRAADPEGIVAMGYPETKDSW